MLCFYFTVFDTESINVIYNYLFNKYFKNNLPRKLKFTKQSSSTVLKSLLYKTLLDQEKEKRINSSLLVAIQCVLRNEEASKY